MLRTLKAPARMIAPALLAVVWAPPAAAGGFPCIHFQRGDANADGVVDISDGVGTLGYLFLGEEAPGCQDAADADDSGGLDITDAVFTFEFLFLGGRTPPSPGPFGCGGDPTFDALGCVDASSTCGGVITETRDLSGFSEFRYSQAPGLGYCAELDRVFTASISRSGEGVYRVEMSILRAGDARVDPCLPDFVDIDPACAVPRDLPPRDLDAGETERMQALFSQVTVIPGPDPICQCVAIDPCVIRNFRWDGQAFSAFECSGLRIERDQAGGILAFLESLRPRNDCAPPAAACPQSRPPDLIERSFVRGDVNGDGAVDISDAVAVLEWLCSGGPPLECLDAADFNDDGCVDLADAAFFPAPGFCPFLDLGLCAPRPPFPDCGPDPTPDFLGCDSSSILCR